MPFGDDGVVPLPQFTFIKRADKSALFSPAKLREAYTKLEQVNKGELDEVSFPDIEGNQQIIKIQRGAKYQLGFLGTFTVTNNDSDFKARDLRPEIQKNIRQCPIYISKVDNRRLDMDRIPRSSDERWAREFQKLTDIWERNHAHLKSLLEFHPGKIRTVTKVVCLGLGRMSFATSFYLHKVACLISETLQRKQATTESIKILSYDPGHSIKTAEQLLDEKLPTTTQDMLKTFNPPIEAVEGAEAIPAIDRNTFIVNGQDIYLASDPGMNATRAIPFAELAIDAAGDAGPAGMLTCDFGSNMDIVYADGVSVVNGTWSPQWATGRMCEWRNQCVVLDLVKNGCHVTENNERMFYQFGNAQMLLRKKDE